MVKLNEEVPWPDDEHSVPRSMLVRASQIEFAPEYRIYKSRLHAHWNACWLLHSQGHYDPDLIAQQSESMWRKYDAEKHSANCNIKRNQNDPGLEMPSSRELERRKRRERSSED